MPLQEVLQSLLSDLDGSRVTLRQETDGDVFPVTHEALATGAGSIIGLETPNMATQPVVVRVLDGQQVIQSDCRSEFVDDAPFHEMLGLYGDMRAQIVDADGDRRSNQGDRLASRAQRDARVVSCRRRTLPDRGRRRTRRADSRLTV